MAFTNGRMESSMKDSGRMEYVKAKGSGNLVMEIATTSESGK